MDESRKNSLFQSVAFASAKELNDIDWSDIAIDCCDKFGNSLLHYACAHGNTEAVLFLLGRGASVELPNAVGWIPVHQASRFGHIDVVRLLSRQRAGLSRTTALGASCIALAAAGGHLEVVEFLSSVGCRLDEVGRGFPLVTVAAQRANLPCLRHLVSRCSLEAAAEAPVTPLEAAVVADDAEHALDACRLLLAMGADAASRNAAGASPAEVALALNRTEVAQLLQQHRRSPKRRSSKSKETNGDANLLPALLGDPIEAVKRNNAVQLRDMLATNRRALLDFQTEDGATPLMHAAMMGHHDCCQLLLEAGCDVDKQDDVNGWTALMQAIFHNQKSVVRLLLRHRARPDLRSKNDLTALDIALLCEGDDNKEIVALLSSEKSLRSEHRRMWRRLEDLGLSNTKLDDSTAGSQLSHNRTRPRLWGAMTRRWRHQLSSSSASPSAAPWRGSSASLTQRATNRFSAALAKLALPFRRSGGGGARRVRFHDDPEAKAATAEEGDAGADVLPPAPSFRPPQMDIEETARGITAIRAALHAELDLNELSVFTNHANHPALPSPLLSGSSSTLVASSLSLSGSTSTLQASAPSSTSSDQGGPQTLARLLQRLGCEHLTPIFVMHEVDLDSFACLSETDLLEMDIGEHQTVRILLDAIAAQKSAHSDLCAEAF